MLPNIQWFMFTKQLDSDFFFVVVVVEASALLWHCVVLLIRGVAVAVAVAVAVFVVVIVAYHRRTNHQEHS